MISENVSREGQICISIPESAAGILNALHEAGYEAYVVGGCVRDALLGRTPGDWDITTSARPEQVKSLFRRTVDTGIAHGTVTVLTHGGQYEVTTYRIDGVYEDGRHPKQVSFTGSLKEDLRRRDFTINAMAYSDETGLIDLFGGRKDLAEHRIRAVGVPQERFDEDSLRVMRALRFSAQLGFPIDEKTAFAIKEKSKGLKRVSAERIRTELDKLLMSEHPEVLRDAWTLGVMDEILPELSECMDCAQNNPHHCFTVGEHIIRTVCSASPDLRVRLACLLHDIGKPACRTTDGDGTDHFHGHAAVSAAMAENILRRLKYDNRTRQDTVRLVEYHSMEFGGTKADVRKAAAAVGPELFPLLLEVKEADAAAQSPYRAEEKKRILRTWSDLYAEILENHDPLTLKDLAVHGDDLIAAGCRPSEEFHRILGSMLEAVLENPENNTREYLMERFVPVQA